MIDKKASIIIRTKNEERWITSCLDGVVNQAYENWEIILVDNLSDDKTVKKAKKFPLEKVVTVEEYTPGKALNKGIQEAEGEYIVCLSGHCIPTDEYWLGNLKQNFDNSDVAGVYGNQEPLSFTPDKDKRDLNIIFGEERVEKETDDFFHNANSMIRRDVWKKYPFDESLTNLEDRAWAQKVLNAGYTTIYEPEASVYHYHGIHHDGDEERAQNQVRVLRELSSSDGYKCRNPQELKIVSIIPKKGTPKYINGNPLISYTINQSVQNQFIDQTIVSTDNEETIATAKEYGANVPFKRDSSLSEEYIDLNLVYKHTLEQLEANDIYPDILVLLEPTYPFRPTNLIDDIITQYVRRELDTLFAGYFENKVIFKQVEEKIEILTNGIIPRKYQDKTYVGLRGLGCVASPSVLRSGDIYSQNIGIYPVDSPLSRIEVRNIEEMEDTTSIKKALEEMNLMNKRT